MSSQPLNTTTTMSRNKPSKISILLQTTPTRNNLLTITQLPTKRLTQRLPITPLATDMSSLTSQFMTKLTTNRKKLSQPRSFTTISTTAINPLPSKMWAQWTTTSAPLTDAITTPPSLTTNPTATPTSLRPASALLSTTHTTTTSVWLTTTSRVSNNLWSEYFYYDLLQVKAVLGPLIVKNNIYLNNHSINNLLIK